MPPDNCEELKIQDKYKSLITTREEACSSDRKILVKNEDLTEKQEIKKRERKDDKQLMQFIFTEKRTGQGDLKEKMGEMAPKIKSLFI